MEKKPSRQRVKMIPVPVLPTEKSQIEKRAKECGLKTATFLRELGLNHRPKTTLDAEAVLELVKANADLGRLGGLLKMLLTNKERLNNNPLLLPSIEALLADLATAQATLLAAARRV